jgi:hypothetical protein
VGVDAGAVGVDEVGDAGPQLRRPGLEAQDEQDQAAEGQDRSGG